MTMEICWQGTVNAWECDEMGHMNVRFYGAKIEEALTGLLADQSAPIAPVAAHHIRYLRECRAGTPLRILGGALTRGRAPRLYFEVQDSSSLQPRASFVTRLHDAADLPPGPCIDMPAHGAPRGLPDTSPRANPSLADADQAGLVEITRTIIQPHQIDATGAVRPHQVIGMISDGVASLMRRINPERGQHDSNLGGAALEQRVFIRAQARAGDPVTVRSGIVEAGEKTMRIVHWLLNRRTGEAFATSEVIAVTFDLTARRAVPLPEEARDRIAAMAVRAEA